MCVKSRQTQYCCIKEGFLHFFPSVGGEEKLETYSHAIYTVYIQIENAETESQTHTNTC